MGVLEFRLLHKNRKTKVHDNSSFLIKLRIIIPPILGRPWMCNNSSEIFRKKQSVRCVQRQLTIPRLSHVFTHSALSVSTNMQGSPESSCKRRSNVLFVRHLFKSPKATRSRICPLLIISTNWWMSWLLKIAAHRPKNVAVVMRTTPLPLTVSCARTFYALLVLKLTNA